MSLQYPEEGRKARKHISSQQTQLHPGFRKVILIPLAFWKPSSTGQLCTGGHAALLLPLCSSLSLGFCIAVRFCKTILLRLKAKRSKRCHRGSALSRPAVHPPQYPWVGAKPSSASLALYCLGPKSLKHRNSSPCLQTADNNKKIQLSHQILNFCVWATAVRMFCFGETRRLVRKHGQQRSKLTVVRRMSVTVGPTLS